MVNTKQDDLPTRKLLTVEEVAGLLRVPVRTLYAWRHRGIGPLSLKVGRHLRYRPADLDQYIDGLADERTQAGRSTRQ